MADPEPEKEEVAPVEPRRPPNIAYHHDMAMALLEARDETEQYLDYAVWLSENNDPRGALIRAMMEGDESLVEAHPAQFLGPLAFEQGVQVTWKMGFWNSVSVKREWEVKGVPQLLEEALQHPSALVLDSLTLEADCAPDFADKLGDLPPLPLRRLVVDVGNGPLGAWASVWAKVAQLRELELRGSNPQLGDLGLDLTSLALHGPLAAEALWSVARMNAPNLTSLWIDSAQADPKAGQRIRERFGEALERAGCDF